MAHHVGGVAIKVLRAPINLSAGLYMGGGVIFSNATFLKIQITDDLHAYEALGPGAGRDRVILYLHGGGHWLLSAGTYKNFIGNLSEATKACVVAVEYRKPPDHLFPAGLNDTITAWNWAQARYPGASVAVCGDSSGANLAFALLVKLAQLELPQPVACVGISPWLHLNMTSAVSDLYGRFCVHMYLGGHRKLTTAADPLVSPALASPEMAKRFPPILMHAGSNELTTEDVKRMAALLEEIGKPAEVRFFGCPHIFQVAPGFPKSTKESLELIGAFLEKHWTSNPPQLGRASGCEAAPAAAGGAAEASAPASGSASAATNGSAAAAAAAGTPAA